MWWDVTATMLNSILLSLQPRGTSPRLSTSEPHSTSSGCSERLAGSASDISAFSLLWHFLVVQWAEEITMTLIKPQMLNSSNRWTALPWYITKTWTRYPVGCMPSSSVAKRCPTLCDCSTPGSSVHGISGARILHWVAISFSRGSSQPRDRTHVSCIGRWILCHWATRGVHTVGGGWGEGWRAWCSLVCIMKKKEVWEMLRWRW